MSVNYPQKFGQIGKLIKHLNEFTTLESTTLPADLADILTQYGTSNTGVANAQSQVSGLTDAFLALMNGVGSMKTTLASYAAPTMTDYDSVVSQLAGASSQDVTGTLLLLYRDMLANSQTVVRSTVTVGPVTADPGNVGTGTVIVDRWLDGYSSPVSGGPANPLYAGVASELAPPSATYAFVCSGDSYGFGGGTTPAGSEAFTWDDGVNFPPFSPYPEGAGAGPGLTAAGGNSVTAGGYFSNFSSNVPAGWSLVGTGVAGTNVLQDTANTFGANSASSLALVGGAQTIGVSTPAGPGTVTPRRRYLVTAYAQRTSGTGPSGVFKINFTGTGYTPAASEQVTVAVSGIPTTWTLYSFFLTAPAALPPDFALQIEVVNDLDVNTRVNVANAFVTPVTYFGGVSATVVGGKTPFAGLDKFTCTVSNDGAGLFQEFSRVNWGWQWPSATTPSVSGAYALLLPYSLFTGAGVSSATLSNSLAS